MTSQTAQSLWTVARDDDNDTYDILDPTEAVIASVPIGATSQAINRQQYVRDLIVASPILLATAKQLVEMLASDKPDLDGCRALLERAISAARGQR
jgi:hypothetical protein